MKFTIKRLVIEEGLEKASKGIAKTTNLPILTGILLKVTEEEVVLTASSSDTSIKIVLPVDNDDIVVETPGATVLQIKALEIVKKFKGDEVVFETDEKDFTTITSKKAEFEIAGFNSEEFPKLPEVSKGSQPSFVLNGKEFLDMIRKTSFCASTNETRPILQAVLFDISKDCINFVATDSHRLGKVTRSSQNDEEQKFPIPSKSLTDMSKVFDFELDIEVFVQSNVQLVFRNGNTIFYSRLLEGNYPDTSRLIPENEFKSELTLNRKELEESLEQISILAEDGKKNAVARMEIEGLMVSIKSTASQRSKGKVELAYSNFEGEPLTISFSCKFVLDAVKSFNNTEEVVLQFQGPMKPFLITPVESKDSMESIQLVLPVRTY
jgi:DNA polymerase-3 subunit beta